MTQVARNEKIRNLTGQVENFDMSNPVHRAHYVALEAVYGELAAVMLVSQDAARQAYAEDCGVYGGTGLELTDPGEIATYIGWTHRNRVVRHGEKAWYYIIDPDAETKVGGQLVAMFTRDQTVPAHTQQD